MTRRKYIHLLTLFLILPYQLLSQNWDNKTLLDFNHHSINKQAVYLYSQSIFPSSILLPTSGLIYGYVHRDEKLFLTSSETIAALSLTYISTNLLKHTIQRDRPFHSIPDVQAYYKPSGYSFPSGHTSFAFSLATSISLNYREWYYIIPSYLYAIGIGYSRINLGVHYPSDVIIGGMVGIGSAILTHYLMRQFNLRKQLPRIKRFSPNSAYSLYTDSY